MMGIFQFEENEELVEIERKLWLNQSTRPCQYQTRKGAMVI